MYKLWWSHKDKNFGDMLNPILMDYFNIKYSFAREEDANMLCIGSIIRRAKKGCIVLGSGIMFNKEDLSPHANYRFVRGPHTRKTIIECGGTCPEIYGDPGLLLPLFCEELNKKYDVGIVPHFIDYKYVKQTYSNYYIIDVINNDPLEVAKKITQCKTIISSSLHGIIAAHAYGIPAAWVKFSNNVKGNDAKFKDYFASINLDSTASTMKEPIFTLSQININPIVNIFKEYSN